MKSQWVGLATLCALLAAGCGKSLSDADKAAAASAAAVFSSTSPSLRLEAEKIARARIDDRTSCAPGTTTLNGMTIATTCPADGSTTITVTATGPFTKTCGATTFTAANLSATVNFLLNATTIAATANITATVNSKPLACNFGQSVSLTTGAKTVSSGTYSCTYDGVNVDQTTIQNAKCS
jgi:hypothetical protein